MKATAEEYDFHQRILARDDPIAFAAFAELFYDSLWRMCAGMPVLALILRSLRKRWERHCWIITIALSDTLQNELACKATFQWRRIAISRMPQLKNVDLQGTRCHCLIQFFKNKIKLRD